MADTINHGPIGHCIYCGTTDPDLSREHVVPLSLGGNHVLLKASCNQCARTINQFETFCAHTLFGPYRVRGDLPTRRPKERPLQLPLGLVDAEGVPYDVEISPSEHPAALLLPIFAEPRLLMIPGEERRE